MNALDVENGSSSWNSEGTDEDNADLTIYFGRSVVPTMLKVQFQAGFSSELFAIYDPAMMKLGELEFDDIHEIQTRDIFDNKKSFDSLKFILSNFSDFYGRVILYKLEIWGYEDQTNGSSSPTKIL
jgi:hypothetical protein